MPKTYYNEFDKNAAAWLRELIKRGLIPDGDVDERSICDVQPNDLVGYRQWHFFAGIGGWPLALQFAGVPDDFPIATGSCPCQPFSNAGKRKGASDERHLWPQFARIIKGCYFPVVAGEQVASRDGREWLSGVRTDLEGMGYEVGAADLCAAGEGAPHIRQRLFWIAYSKWNTKPWIESCCWSVGRVGRVKQPVPWHEHWQSALSRFRAMDYGIPRNVAATDGARNAIVPQVAATFLRCAFESIAELETQNG